MKNTHLPLTGTFTLHYNHGTSEVVLQNSTIDDVLQKITNIYDENNTEPDSITLPDDTTINYYPVYAGCYWKSRITPEQFIEHSFAATNENKKEVCTMSNQPTLIEQAQAATSIAQQKQIVETCLKVHAQIRFALESLPVLYPEDTEGSISDTIGIMDGYSVFQTTLTDLYAELIEMEAYHGN